MITFSCPACRTKLQALDHQGGAMVNCPSCGQRMLVPALAEKDRVVNDATQSLQRVAQYVRVCCIVQIGAAIFCAGFVMNAFLNWEENIRKQEEEVSHKLEEVSRKISAEMKKVEGETDKQKQLQFRNSLNSLQGEQRSLQDNKRIQNRDFPSCWWIVFLLWSGFGFKIYFEPFSEAAQGLGFEGSFFRVFYLLIGTLLYAMAGWVICDSFVSAATPGRQIGLFFLGLIYLLVGVSFICLIVLLAYGYSLQKKGARYPG